MLKYEKKKSDDRRKRGVDHIRKECKEWNKMEIFCCGHLLDGVLKNNYQLKFEN